MERILVDIESQRDFFSPGGSLHAGRNAPVAGNIYRLFAWARRHDVPVISTVLRVRAGELGPLGESPHCIEGTRGEEKLPRTILVRRINLGLRNTTDLPGHIFRRYQQVIFEKRQTDIFAHARAERLITELPMTTFVLCGAGVSAGIAQAAVGLRSRGLSVVVASDAILAVRDEAAEMARKRMAAKGAIFVPTRKIVDPAACPRRRLYRSTRSSARQAI